MAMESDGKNSAQLVRWAGIANYLQLITRDWLHGTLSPNFAHNYSSLVFPLIWEFVQDGGFVAAVFVLLLNIQHIRYDFAMASRPTRATSSLHRVRIPTSFLPSLLSG